MPMNPDHPAFSDFEDNPYAPPEAQIGKSVPPGESDDLVQAEVIRRKYLNHEASVKSIGSLHYLGALFVVLVCGMFLFDGRFRNRQPAMGPYQRAGAILYFGFLTALNVVMGIGLTGLKPWARWTEVVLTTLSLLVALFLASHPGAHSPIPGLLLLQAVIPAFILYLLLSQKGSMVFSPEYTAIIERTPHIRYQTSCILKGCLIVFVAMVVFAVVAAILGTRR